MAQSQLRDADKALLTQYADHLDREADALERLAASIGFLLSPRADQCKCSSSRLAPRLRPTCQRKRSSFVQCGASRAKAATSLAHRRGRRQAAAVKPEDIGPRLVTSSAGKLASDTKGIAVRLCFMRELQVQWIRKLVLEEGEANRRPANSVRCGARSSKLRKSVLPRANARCRRRNNLDSMSRRLWSRSANSPSVHGSPRDHV